MRACVRVCLPFMFGSLG